MRMCTWQGHYSGYHISYAHCPSLPVPEYSLRTIFQARCLSRLTVAFCIPLLSLQPQRKMGPRKENLRSVFIKGPEANKERKQMFSEWLNQFLSRAEAIQVPQGP